MRRDSTINKGVPPNEVRPWRRSTTATSRQATEVEKMPGSSHLTLNRSSGKEKRKVSAAATQLELALDPAPAAWTTQRRAGGWEPGTTGRTTGKWFSTSIRVEKAAPGRGRTAGRSTLEETGWRSGTGGWGVVGWPPWLGQPGRRTARAPPQRAHRGVRDGLIHPPHPQITL